MIIIGNKCSRKDDLPVIKVNLLLISGLFEITV